MENAKLLGADEYLGTKEGVLMLEEKVDEGVRERGSPSRRGPT